jgi:EAL domain-containing protein (putative c-di-GMP-specific phosphodiesterase class I)
MLSASALGCDMIQGYLLSKPIPLPLPDIIRWLAAWPGKKNSSGSAA